MASLVSPQISANRAHRNSIHPFEQIPVTYSVAMLDVCANQP